MKEVIPLFSIVIPVYNVEKYLSQCLQSVLGQSFQNYEIIFVNDGSEDHSLEIGEKFARRNDKITIINQENKGLSCARNTGVSYAKGNFIIFLDSDDYWNDSDFLEELSKVIKKNPEVDIINFGWSKYFQVKGEFVADSRHFSLTAAKNENRKEVAKWLVENDLFVACAWNKCIRKAFITNHKLQFRHGVRSEDMEWCGNILYLMPHMTCYNSKAYIYRQQRIDSITATVDKAHVQDIISMIKDAQDLSQNLSTENRNIYLSFYAVQYLTLIYNIRSKKLRTDRQLYKETYDLRNILKYDLNKKVKVVRKVNAILGFRLTSILLYYYVK
ncbi:hypothetical protein CBW16_03610 [Flavobacteriaceae bacterium JJC]|nr:hypothetical protein CBW16_03610 [Flavobacteriaceae bacterium JJC]